MIDAKPKGPNPTPPGNDALSVAFGDLSHSARPEFAALNVPEPEPPPVAPKPVEPAAATAREEEPAADTKPEPAAPAAPAEGAGGEPSLGKLAKEPEALQAIIDKYGSPERMASAFVELQRLQSGTATERKAAEEQLAALETLVSENFQRAPDGRFVLRPDAASRALKESGQTFEPPAEIPKKEIRAQVEESYRKQLSEEFSPEDVETSMKRLKPLIDRQVDNEVAQLENERHTAQMQIDAAVGMQLQSHLQKYPGDKELINKIGEVYERFPPGIRQRAILEGWLPLDQVANSVRMQAKLKEAVQEAFELGKKFAVTNVEPADADTTRDGGRTRGRGTGQDDPDAAFKARLVGLNHGTLLESLFGP